MNPALSRHSHLRFFPRLLLLLAVSLCSLPTSWAFDPEEGLTLGVFPRRSAATTRTMFTPLSTHLATLMGVPVKLDTPPDFSAFWQRLSSGEYQLVHLNQYQYLRAHAKHGFDAIAMNEEFGNNRIAAVIWTNQDSRIEQLSDLRGKTLLLGGGRDAMMASIVPRYLMAQAGLAADSYLVRSTLHPVKAVLALAFRQGDAAGSGEVVPQLPSVRAKLGGRPLRELARSKPLAHLPWAISDSVTPADSQAISNVLLHMNDNEDGRAALRAAGLTGLKPANDADYAPHRDIVWQVLGEDYR